MAEAPGTSGPVGWERYKGSKAKFVPSIFAAASLDEMKQFFAGKGLSPSMASSCQGRCRRTTRAGCRGRTMMRAAPMASAGARARASRSGEIAACRLEFYTVPGTRRIS